jgi:hypothetical protein
MTDFTKQLLTYKGEPMTQNEISVVGKKKVITPFDITLQRCAKFALLDVAKVREGLNDTLNSAESMYKRYLLMKRIDANPTEVELTDDEKKLLTALLPAHYEVIIVGQIMELLQ